MSLNLNRRRWAVNSLRLLWVLVTLWNELGIFTFSIKKCTWPKLSTSSEATGQSYHILIVADPQILDHRSYPNRFPLLTYISQLVVDLNLRKNWRAALRKNPDAVVFLGDMMDGGRHQMSDIEYEKYYARFKSIFKLDASIPEYFIPGNHDTGLGISSSFSPKARDRYINHFGQPNTFDNVANHTFVFLDAPAFVEEDYQLSGTGKTYRQWEPIPGGTMDFMKQFSKESHPFPVVLFTHIPLYRPDGTYCGPLRERGTIRVGVGMGYQNTLGKHASQRLLATIQPSLIFSGDDHDYCEYTHAFTASDGIRRQVREVSVKSLSMAMNVRRPGFQLLSLARERYSEPSFADIPCTLPDQLRIYLQSYLVLLGSSVFIICLYHFFRSGHYRAREELHPFSMTQAPRNPPSRLRIRLERTKEEFHSDSNSLPTPASAGRTKGTPMGHGISSILPKVKIPFFSQVTRMRTRRGLLRNILSDVVDIALFPLLVFICTTWWTVAH